MLSKKVVKEDDWCVQFKQRVRESLNEVSCTDYRMRQRYYQLGVFKEVYKILDNLSDKVIFQLLGRSNRVIAAALVVLASEHLGLDGAIARTARCFSISENGLRNGLRLLRRLNVQ